ncbi:HEPN domain-containing protein [Aeromonas sp. Y318-1]|uniref:ApeA N-terminal domain 1-containing protein n=1 Tax=Aeromonas TaxID=642 RepID=UPI0022DEC779|nr:HEPN domain-containing protein [Aeromonas sp. Y318-1]
MKYTGSFWSFSSPYKKVLCTLEITDDGEAKLFSFEPFSNNDAVYEENIYSELELSRYISILKPFYRTKKQRDECTLGAHIVFVGGSTVHQIEDVKIRHFCCDLGNASDFFFENRFFESNGYRTPPKKEIAFNSKLGWSAKLSFTSQNSVCRLRISNTLPETLDFYQNVAHKICTFLSFSIGDIVYTKNISLVDVRNKYFNVHYTPSFSPRKKNSKRKALFLYGLDLEDKFTKWCELCDSSEEILRLYFLPMLTELDQTTYFILRAQFLEAFHRKVTGNNKLSFQKRILSILNNREYSRYLPIKGSRRQKLKDLSIEIKDIRNYYTHYNENDRYKKPNGKDLFFINLKVRLISQLYLMDYFGFKSTDFNEIRDIIITDKYNRLSIIEKYTKS